MQFSKRTRCYPRKGFPDGQSVLVLVLFSIRISFPTESAHTIGDLAYSPLKGAALNRLTNISYDVCEDNLRKERRGEEREIEREEFVPETITTTNLQIEHVRCCTAGFQTSSNRPQGVAQPWPGGGNVAALAATATPTAQLTSTASDDCAGLDAGVDVGDCLPTHAPATCVRVVAQSEAESKSN